MSSCLRLATALVVLGFGAAFANADLSLPTKKKTGPGYTTVTVEPGPEGRLIIPRAVLKQILKAEADGGAGDTRVVTLTLPTIMIGLCLSMALVCSGLWLVRAGRAGKRVAAALTFVGLVGATTATLWANAGPPVRPPAFKGTAIDSVRVVISDTEKNVRLQLTPPQTTALRTNLMNALVAPPAGATPPPFFAPGNSGKSERPPSSNPNP